MTKQVVENIPKKKLDTVKELVDLIKTKRTILVADVSGIPGSQYQAIVKKLRGKAIVKVPKRNLLFRALETAGKEEAKKLEEKIEGAVAILFSDLDSYELAAELLKSKSPAKAKPGQIAPSNIEIPAGPTDLTPGPAISELGALGIQIMIQGGKIEIKEAKTVAEEGKEISQGAADMLSKLSILPFTIGFAPVSAYDAEDNVVYNEIKIDTEATVSELLEAYSRALPFAVEVGYISSDTVPFMIQKAGAHERKLIRVITGEPEEVAPVAEAAPAEEETKEEEKKEEEPVSFGSFF
jgi:large subunit ribosomal protein L10